jgi:hypothetical protein
MATKKELSLLPDSENPNSFSARAIKWLSTVGRWIIVLTELIVVTAFISRFWLDRKNSDLSEVIRQQQAIIESTQTFEKEFNSFQQRLKFIKDFYATSPSYDDKMSVLVKSTPPDLIYKNLALKPDINDSNKVNANASLIAFKEDSIVNFITNLMINDQIESVTINQIEKKSQENSYSVTLSVVFKNSVFKT